MENIIIFIIIIIISSIVSKNKKKQASQQQPTVFNDKHKRTSANEPPPQLGELLRQLKGLKNETTSSKTFSEMKKPAEQIKPAGEKEYSTKPVSYDERNSEDILKETYTYDTPEKDYDSVARSYETEFKSYDEMSVNEERNVNYEEVKGDAYMDSVRRSPQENVTPINKKHPKVSFLDSKIKLRSAIITSEILKRKYT